MASDQFDEFKERLKASHRSKWFFCSLEHFSQHSIIVSNW
jgi:hypothetical protein